MSKVKITEERLQNMISECVQEVLMESLEDEGLGSWLGKAYQWGRNKWNNFRSDFNAGRNYMRYKNKDYDPYGEYQNGDDFRNFNGQKYADYRYDLTADRNNASKQWADSKYKNKNNAAPQGEAPAQPQQQTGPMAAPFAQPQQQATPNVGPNNNRDRSNLASKSKEEMQKAAKFLTDNGHKLVNGQWIYTKDGSNWPALKSQYKAIRNAAQKYNIASKGVNGVYESKIREIVSESLKEYLNEIGDTASGQEKLGRLSARRFNQASDERRKADNSENPEDEKKHLDKKHNLMQRSMAAYDKAAKERDEHPGLKQYYGNAFNGGERKELKKARK